MPCRRRVLMTVIALFGFLSISPHVFAQAGSPSATSIKTIYIIPSSHWDLGFLAPPEEILPRLKPHIDQVIVDCKADPEFRWTVESAWQLREWAARSTPEEIRDFSALVNRGQIQVSAVFGSMHTEFVGAEQLNRLAWDMRTLESQLGIKTNYAMMDDVPGFTLRLPQVLAASGVRYFVTGSNLFIGGGTSLTPGRMPFYWEGPDGSRVLMWQTQGRFGGYTEALSEYYLDPQAREPYTKEHFYPKEWQGQSDLEVMQRGVDGLLKKYGDAGYKYDAAMVLYLHDFIPPSWEKDSLMPAVRAWNTAGRQPRLVIATPAEFFSHMEFTYGKDFPVYRGDFSGLWSEVKTNSPRISGAARWVQQQWPAAEMLWSLLTFREGTSFPSGNFDADRFNLLKYEEHSGAAQVGWPKLMSRAEVDQQNREYVQYLKDARQDLEQLISTGMTTLFAQRDDAPAADNLVVFNSLSWTRDGEVTLDVPSGEEISVHDVETSTVVPSQRISSTQIVFRAESVPGPGYKTYALEKAPPKAAAHPATPSLLLENRFYRLRVRPDDGAIVSLYDKELALELVNPKNPSLNGLSRWTLLNSFKIPGAHVEIAREEGSLIHRLIIRRPGTFWPETLITLPSNRKSVEFSNRLDRSRMPYVANLQPSEAYTFNFAFAFDKPARVLAGNGDGFYRIPDDNLPGARTDAAVIQQSLILEGTEQSKPLAVVLTERQPFFNCLPGMPAGKDRFLNAVQVLALRKQDQGDTRDLGMVNFEDVELGMENDPLQFDFALTSLNAADLASLYRVGNEYDTPLIAARMLPHSAPVKSSGSFFMVDAPNVALTAFRPSLDGNPTHYTIRFQEVAGIAAQVTIATPLKISQAEEVNLTEDTVISQQSLPLRFNMGPNQTVTLRLTIPHQTKTRSNKWWEWD